MAICARRPCPHDALGTVRYRPNPPARFLRAAADSNAHLLLFSPGPGCAIRFSSASRKCTRNGAKCPYGATPDSNKKNQRGLQKKKNTISSLERAVRTFARRESFFLFKLQPKRWLQWVQAVTETHPSNSCQSNMRTENRGMEKESRKSHRNFTNTITQRRRGKKKQDLVSTNVWNSPPIPSPNSAAAILFLKDAQSHPRMAHRREVPAPLSTDVREKTKAQISKLSPLSSKSPFHSPACWGWNPARRHC